MNTKDFNIWIPDVIIYHEVVPGFPCSDGIAAAWVCFKKFSEVNLDLQLLGWTYQQNEALEVPEVYEKKIMIVDFSFPQRIIDCLEMVGNEVYVIDHHRSYLESLVKINKIVYPNLTEAILKNERIYYKDDSLFVDTSECGATLTWNLLFPNEVLPEWLKYIRANDLFIFDNEETPFAEEWHFACAKFRRTFSMFDQFQSDCESGDWDFTLQRLIPIGKKSIEAKIIQMDKIIANPKKTELWQLENDKDVIIPAIKLNKSEMSLKSRIAKHIIDKYNYLFVVILDTESTKVRVKSSNHTDLLSLFNDFNPAGHPPACSFSFKKSKKELQLLILERAQKLKNIQQSKKELLKVA